MNQAILFNDDISYQQGELTFTAMASGQLIRCKIATKFEQDAAIAHFAQHQFDYEMQAEQLIEEEAFNEAGEISLAFL
ncbi:DUF1488 domain-containing protein [Pseudoalteromonas piscicida]|uniref:DUF1488 domain-containing protein n=1 Tax=Pseudoalteromonas piscicida TaxID=43662 RepID=A0AAQ2EU82_PSEO7|nr:MULTISPECIES: DUF1488 family protein [Pseudoalteromonas]KJY86068.1 hypothetical protein TW75_18525 [Pseudoalteromonas piscicida]TMN36395.1 DUF1488 domain-containing protein [Pseudoalteromonas piscicida]TMN43146.1 DUF1488 domain-containing protein [Pseudoalteromonas piscicida]TMN54443.1 DUF1488 domain-containing protein [Pseudoalteromonas piscicida]TMN54945.1 DUF1488 domain-containing protein [Pseudoalteromonas piscicida]